MTVETQAAARVCVECGCDDLHACAGGCAWASLDPPLCTTCADSAEVEFAAHGDGLIVSWRQFGDRLWTTCRVVPLRGQSLLDLICGALHVVARGGPTR